eukprot:2155869-Rhodomonas_salina.2
MQLGNPSRNSNLEPRPGACVRAVRKFTVRACAGSGRLMMGADANTGPGSVGRDLRFIQTWRLGDLNTSTPGGRDPNYELPVTVLIMMIIMPGTGAAESKIG